MACALGTAGCYTHQCDGTTSHYHGGELTALGDGTYAYESSPLSAAAEQWVSFPGNATIVVTYPPAIASALAGCPAVGSVEAWVGTSGHPNDDDGSTFAQTAGELAQFTRVSNKGFSVTNGSCASYSARFRITYGAADGGACGSGVDGGP